MAYTSKYRMARISPTKARPVLNMIRGKRIEEATVILAMSKLRAAVTHVGRPEAPILGAHPR